MKDLRGLPLLATAAAWCVLVTTKLVIAEASVSDGWAEIDDAPTVVPLSDCGGPRRMTIVASYAATERSPDCPAGTPCESFCTPTSGPDLGGNCTWGAQGVKFILVVKKRSPGGAWSSSGWVLNEPSRVTTTGAVTSPGSRGLVGAGPGFWNGALFEFPATTGTSDLDGPSPTYGVATITAELSRRAAEANPNDEFQIRLVVTNDTYRTRIAMSPPRFFRVEPVCNIDAATLGPPAVAPTAGAGAGLTTMPPASAATCDELGVAPRARAHPTVCGWSRFGPPDHGSICHDATSHAGAAETCATVGARLCSVDELAGNVAAGTGCGFDQDYVWAADVCAGGGHVRTAGRNEQLDNNPAVCVVPTDATAATVTAAVRCCADQAPPPTQTPEIATPTARSDATVAPAITLPAREPSTATCDELGIAPRARAHPTVCGWSQFGPPDQGPICYDATSHAGATETCAAVGARLCSVDELAGNVAAGAGCGFDQDYVWAADVCADGGTHACCWPP